ncbi:MAG: efflux RND transporter periplasmic adaptor subunit [Atopobiaceae bacterium]|jgi:HlyD family secretion protein|nr:efflux RND transporter periplasmic adaptor subunit [Atopobiaceae bacterium]MCH4119149.1 efflux RND transporter periplasmic adaptor subunit [Atopobiaceae bacterium]MCI1318785.1 efflux RND transporter periplasmic adaptor subunit [Atopobiaceae bacterium]MCI1388592.1 efflux RND transporter periplasmic adaptor subunit [Atopobiaceae bacterium]MCI1432091.1 efflux RND transporter periplasmic adaptor subunit [Atopobiaceae bacterium]
MSSEEHARNEADETTIVPASHLATMGPKAPGDPDAQGPHDEDEEALLAVQSLERHRKERRRRKIVRTLVVVAIVAAVAIFAILHGMSSEDDTGETLATASAYTGTLTDSVSVSGAAQPVTSVWATPEIEGTIATVNVTEGQQVNAGDVLFTIKNDSLDQDVSSAQAAVASAEAQLSSAKAQLAAGQQAQTAAQQAADGDGLGDGGGDASGVDVASLNAAVAEAQANLQSARLTLDNAQAQANKRTVVSPIAGTVLSCTAEVGASTTGSASGASGSSSTPAQVQIADLSQLKVRVQVDEDDIVSVAEGQAAKVTFSALPDVELDAQVVHIAATTSASADASAMGDSGSASYDVDVLIPSPDPRIKPGMTADVEIIFSSLDDALIVPSTAVTDNGDGTGSVTVVTYDDEGKASMEDVSVQILLTNDSETAVKPTSGSLDDGDLVLLGGSGGNGDSGSDGSDVVYDEAA